MVKGDTALDMRGRCSAGQKVCEHTTPATRHLKQKPASLGYCYGLLCFK